MKRVAVTPEDIGLCGCWQVIAVERLSIDLTKPKDPPSLEVGYYCSSLTVKQYDDQAIGEIIRGHWSAIENGTHYRRDVTLGEDDCRVRTRQGPQALATLRNLVNGIYELELAHNRTAVGTLNSWCEQQTFTTAWKILNR